LITDLVLPGLDGLALIERLTEDKATTDLPIMVISLDADLSRVQAVVGLGAQDFLVVPFDLEVLQSKVEKLLDKPQGRGQKKRTPARAAQSAAAE
jgi:DNA-binding response OmpR family regulator